ncbi:IS66 family insertion sequence element accessory protein TnpB [Enhydrobacter sp.]|jgi:hypothetical protein|uniref:IS66 family insertion sequence element accessory protein TnpB n=1 Tax=Enhydrobacter sp. TaxID=1894999 RepID=UPI0027AB369B|nr:MAG: Mobile element protein [Enhydrobacter sp.]
MSLLPSGVKIHVALGVTDMRKGLDGLAMLVQGVLKQDPFSGHLFLFRGRKAELLKILWWDGTGLCLFTKRLEQSRFFSYGLCQGLRAPFSNRPVLDVYDSNEAIRKGENAGLLRRSLRLLCGDWIPHDDGASEGCLALATDVGIVACPTRIRGFPLPCRRPRCCGSLMVGLREQAVLAARSPR